MNSAANGIARIALMKLWFHETGTLPARMCMYSRNVSNFSLEILKATCMYTQHAEHSGRTKSAGLACRLAIYAIGVRAGGIHDGKVPARTLDFFSRTRPFSFTASLAFFIAPLLPPHTHTLSLSFTHTRKYTNIHCTSSSGDSSIC